MRKYNTQNSKKAKRKKWKRMFLSKTFRIVLICLTLFFFSVYIVKKSSMATRGYKISELKQRIDKLENENERIQVKIARKKSLKSITKRLDEDQYRPIQNLEYNSLEGTAVAQK